MAVQANHAVVGIDIGLSSTKYVRTDCTVSSTPDKSCHETPTELRKLRRMVACLACPSGEAMHGIAIGGILDRKRIVSHRLRPDWVGESPAEWLGVENCLVINDADAALIYYLNRNPERAGERVALLTLGTGVGSAAFIDGDLIPNLELGHTQLEDDRPIHDAISAREVKRITYLSDSRIIIEALLKSVADAVVEATRADLIIIAGGGASHIPVSVLHPRVERIDDPIFAGAIGASEVAHDVSTVPVPKYDGLARRNL